MFRELARELRRLPPPQYEVFDYEPLELAYYLDVCWLRIFRRRYPWNPGISRLQPVTRIWGHIGAFRPSRWRYHLIYAFLIESTGIYEIFTRVLHEVLNGERLGILSQHAQLWVRDTEDLCFKPPPFGSIYGVESRLRPDVRATRRNAYYRMFGTEPAYVQEDHVNFVRPQASNHEFVSTLEALLSEVWLAIINQRNVMGANPTDDYAIAEHTQHLREMLLARRQYGTLSREEFSAVAQMSWFHLTVESNSPIVTHLRATDTSAERRLRRIGERVNMRPHDHAESYFRLADPLAALLRRIERRPPAPWEFYVPGRLRRRVEVIITHWSIVTGRDLKVRASQDFRRIAAHAGQRLQALPAPAG